MTQFKESINELSGCLQYISHTFVRLIELKPSTYPSTNYFCPLTVQIPLRIHTYIRLRINPLPFRIEERIPGSREWKSSLCFCEWFTPDNAFPRTCVRARASCLRLVLSLTLSALGCWKWRWTGISQGRHRCNLGSRFWSRFRC